MNMMIDEFEISFVFSQHCSTKHKKPWRSVSEIKSLGLLFSEDMILAAFSLLPFS